MKMKDYKKDFPLLAQSELVYLDSAATAQRPFSVLAAENEFYQKYNANPLRGLYELGLAATERYEEARDCVRDFLHAASSKEIIFTRNTTESINLVAYSYVLNHLKEGDELLVTIDAHHSNLLPWQMAARQTKAKLRYLDCEQDGSYTQEAMLAAVTPKTKFAALTHISNVTGQKNPVEQLIRLIHDQNGVVLVDAAQSAAHIPLDVQEMDVDFLAFSGHKLMAPMGIGVLYGKRVLLEQMPPFLRGGEMIDSVSRYDAVFAELPYKFEAGTGNGGGAVGLKAAISYLTDIGWEEIRSREEALTQMSMEQMQRIPHLHIQGSSDFKKHHGILSFTIDEVHPHDIASILDADQIAVRAGHHCAQPLLNHLGVFATARASIAFYNTEEDILRFTESLGQVRRKMGYGE